VCWTYVCSGSLPLDFCFNCVHSISMLVAIKVLSLCRQAFLIVTCRVQADRISGNPYATGRVGNIEYRYRYR